MEGRGVLTAWGSQGSGNTPTAFKREWSRQQKLPHIVGPALKSHGLQMSPIPLAHTSQLTVQDRIFFFLHSKMQAPDDRESQLALRPPVPSVPWGLSGQGRWDPGAGRGAQPRLQREGMAGHLSPPPHLPFAIVRSRHFRPVLCSLLNFKRLAPGGGVSVRLLLGTSPTGLSSVPWINTD